MYPYVVLEASSGLDVIEFGCPALHRTIADPDTTLPTPTPHYVCLVGVLCDCNMCACRVFGVFCLTSYLFLYVLRKSVYYMYDIFM